MKRLISALILPLLLLTACKSAEKFDPSDYTFPPEDVREMEWALDEAGLDGYKAEDARMTTDKVPDDIAIMRLTKDGCNTVVMVNMLLFGGVERQCGISFGYNQKPGDEEQLSAFVSDDYPLFWRLAGIALEAPNISPNRRRIPPNGNGAAARASFPAPRAITSTPALSFGCPRR